MKSTVVFLWNVNVQTLLNLLLFVVMVLSNFYSTNK